MFEKYYKKLRFSQKIADRSLVTCMKIIESNRNHVLSTMKDKKVYCHQGCNLCCHSLTLTVDTLNSYTLSRVFETIPYDELFPYYKKCIDNRIKAREYIDSLPVDYNRNDYLEEYNKFGFTVSTCPFVDQQNGCLIYEFRPQICFMYFSSVPCEISLKHEISEEQKIIYGSLKNKAESVVFSGLENDSKSFSFDDGILGVRDKFDDLNKIIKQDPNLDSFLSHTIRFEILTIMSIALEKSNHEKYRNDTRGLEIDLLAYVDGERKFL